MGFDVRILLTGGCAAPALNALLAALWPHAAMHLAAQSHVDCSINGPAVFVQTSVVGTYSILTATRQYWQGLNRQDRAEPGIKWPITERDAIISQNDLQASLFSQAKGWFYA